MVEQERRASVRKRAFLKGVICFNKRSSTLECMIRDISDDGARLVVSSAVAVPSDFELFIPSKNEYLEARQRWRRGDELGVEFLREQELAGLANSAKSADLATRVERLEEQVEMLKRTISKLRAELQRTISVRESLE